MYNCIKFIGNLVCYELLKEWMVILCKSGLLQSSTSKFHNERCVPTGVKKQLHVHKVKERTGSLYYLSSTCFILANYICLATTVNCKSKIQHINVMKFMFPPYRTSSLTLLFTVCIWGKKAIRKLQILR